MHNLEDEIQRINHSREQRTYFSNLIIKNPLLLPQLLDICTLVDEELSYRAAWGLEFLCKRQLSSILPYLDHFTALIPVVYQHPAVRPMAKICEYLAIGYYKDKQKDVVQQLTHRHRKKITETCFDWMISDQKVAVKAYAMTSLYLLGTEFDWVHAELKITLENNYPSSSAAYKARARMILKKIG